MKISSASKKVLASALSAAMVVAFAPTVAFGAVNEGDTVKVKFDTAGLTLQNGSSPFVEKDYIVGANNVIDMGSTFAANHEYKSGTNSIEWYFDANGSGELDGTEVAVGANGQFTIDPATDLTDGTVTLSAHVITAFNVSQYPGLGDTAKQAGWTGAWIGVKVDETGIYSASLAKNGTEIASLPLVNVSNAATDFNVGIFNICDKIDEDHKASNGYVAKDTYGEGTYTLTVTNGAGEKVVKTLNIVKIDLSGIFGTAGSEKNGQTIYAYKGQTLHFALTNCDIDNTAVKYVDGDAKNVTSYTINGQAVETVAWSGSNATFTEKVETKLTGDVVLGAVYEDEVDPTLTLAGKTIKLQLGNVADTTKYKAVITVNGTEYPTVQTGNAWGTATEIYSFGTSGAAGGSYNVVVYEQTEAGTGIIEKKVAEKAIDLAAVTLDAGEGKLADGQKASLGVFQAGTLYRDNGIAADKEVLTGVADPTPTDKTAKFLGWSLDGVNVLKTADKVAAGTAAVTLKAVYSSVKAAAPTYEWANDTLTLANAAGDGYKVVYKYSADGGTTWSANWIDYTAPIQLKKGTNGKIKAMITKTTANTAGKADSAEIEVVNSTQAKTDLDNAIAALALSATVTTSDSASNAPKYYMTELKDEIAAAKAVLTDKGFATSGNGGDWAKLVKQQTLAVLQLVADYETAQVDALAAGVKAADGSVKKIGTAAADKAKATIAQVITDWNYINDKDDATVASKTYADGYVAAIKKAAKDAADAATTYKAADVTAAEAVTAQLKAATTGEQAEAALAAYEALTATQKELVAAADVAAAEAIVAKAEADKAAAELVATQDLAAVKYVNNPKTKTVKLATAKKKATSFTYKSQVSKSGNKVTYKKVSGSSKIKVTKAGKVTLAKVSKKGTYKAKVKVTCGEQTRTVTAKFIVK